MKSISNTYRFIALTMAFLMFFTSVGLAVDMHYCQGKVQSVSFFGKAKSCSDLGVNSEMSNCTKTFKDVFDGFPTLGKTACCHNQTHLFQLDQESEVQIQSFEFSNQLQQFVIAYVKSFYFNVLTSSKIYRTSFYKSPLISVNIPLSFQSFLL